MSGLRVDAVRVVDKVPFSMKLDIENLKVRVHCWWMGRDGLGVARHACWQLPP